MAARYGYADENGYVADTDDNQQQALYAAAAANAKRRATRTFGQANHTITFRPFTRESLLNVGQRRKQSRGANKRNSSACAQTALGAADSTTKAKSEPDPYLASGQLLPPVVARQLPRELIGKPIEDLDPYYADKEVSWWQAASGVIIWREKATDTTFSLRLS